MVQYFPCSPSPTVVSIQMLPPAITSQRADTNDFWRDYVEGAAHGIVIDSRSAVFEPETP